MLRYAVSQCSSSICSNMLAKAPTGVVPYYKMTQMMKYKLILIAISFALMKLFGGFFNSLFIQDILQLKGFRFICHFSKILFSRATSLFNMFLEGQVSGKQCLLNGLNVTNNFLMHESYITQNFQANMFGILDKKSGFLDQKG